MVLGPFDISELTLAANSSPGYYLSRQGVILVAGYKGELLSIKLEGERAYEGALGPIRGLARLPEGKIRVEFDAATGVGDPNPGGLAIVGEQMVCLAVTYQTPDRSVERFVVNVETCRVVAPLAQLEDWIWLSRWSLTSQRPDGTRWTIATSQATEESLPATSG